MRSIFVALLFNLVILSCCFGNARAQGVTLFQRAETALDEKRYADAKLAIDSVLLTEPDNVEAWTLRGYVVQAQEDYKSMVITGRELTRLDPNQRHGWYFLAMGHISTKNYVDFIPAAQKCCSIDAEICRSTKFDLILKSLSQDSLGRQDSIFTTDDKLISVVLPKTWTTRLVTDKTTLNWFISYEPILKTDDAFSIGLSLRWVRGFLAGFKDKAKVAPADVVDTWRNYFASRNLYEDTFRDSTLDSGWVKRGVWQGKGRVMKRTIISSKKLEVGYSIYLLDVTLTHNDDILTLTFECPSDHFKVFHPRFAKAFDTVVLPSAGTLKE